LVLKLIPLLSASVASVSARTAAHRLSMLPAHCRDRGRRPGRAQQPPRGGVARRDAGLRRQRQGPRSPRGPAHAAADEQRLEMVPGPAARHWRPAYGRAAFMHLLPFVGSAPAMHKLLQPCLSTIELNLARRQWVEDKPLLEQSALAEMQGGAPRAQRLWTTTCTWWRATPAAATSATPGACAWWTRRPSASPTTAAPSGGCMMYLLQIVIQISNETRNRSKKATCSPVRLCCCSCLDPWGPGKRETGLLEA
jgi:hypothetical protein